MTTLLYSNNPMVSVYNEDKVELISAISIFAGNDTSICQNSFLDMTQLGAYITGDVSDGIWVTFGDGLFAPNDTAYETFSMATGYTLGTDDIASGSVMLVLVSDDPDGVGPGIQVSDTLVVSLINQPAMACVSNITLSLDNNCEQVIIPEMLVSNISAPYDYYTVTCYDENGTLIVDNALNSTHIDQVIDFEVGHLCGEVSCQGSITILDKSIPDLECSDHYVKCNESHDIQEIGLPIPNTATVVSQDGNTYVIRDFDPCSDVNLTYTEDIQSNSCSEDYTQEITRYWVATDDSGNSTNCTQLVYVDRITLADVILPINFDGNVNPSIHCSDVIDTLENGTPSTTLTGMPDIGECSDMDVLFNDVVINSCGNTYKVIRKWFVFDNCTNESINHNQLIKVTDSIAPVLDCIGDTINIGTNPYTCLASLELEPLSYDDCSMATFSISVLTNYVGDTIPINELFVTNNVINQADSLFIISQLPLGDNWVKYTAEDECGNRSYCFRLITVSDNTPPTISCDGFTSLNIINDGTGRIYAGSLDDESTDNCSSIDFDMRKMTDICGNSTSGYSPFADFCCDEVGTSVMVELRGMDQAGNVNYCMVEVLVNDKIAPTIVAPTDITISCNNYYDPSMMDQFGKVVNSVDLIEDIIVFDDINSGIVGTDGLAEDNCSVVISDQISFNLECQQGTITRTFTATDPGGLTATDKQIITVTNPDPFDENDINWPSDKTFHGCQNTEIDTTDRPTYNNIFCGEVSASHHDLPFPLVEDVCTKIIRTWTVIDWCQYENNNNTGIWTKQQVIKILNLEAPEILSSCQDTSYCLYEEDCGDGTIVLSMSALDDCTPTEDLYYEWVIKDDSEEIMSTGNNASAMVNIGSGLYSIEWLVEDLCGNVSTCSYGFDVKDCKAPTPYCHGEVVSTLMNNSESISIWASDFNIASYDNCTDEDDLIYSFSSDISDQERIYDCDDIDNGIAQNFEIEMWVTDTDGNQDYCAINLLVQDNQDYCTDQSTIGVIGGNILTDSEVGVSNVLLDLECIIEPFSNESFTDNSGAYLNAEMLQNTQHVIKPYKNDELKKYVSTLDLLLIQRHILKLKEFTSPFQLIGADVNRSNSINIADLIHLRKVLLGKLDAFPNNSSWRFVDKSFEFDSMDPYFFPDSILIRSLYEESVNNDFVAVKTGDVNSTYSEFSNLDQGNERSSIELNQVVTALNNNQYLYELIGPENSLDGYQIELSFNKEDYQFANIASSINSELENYNIEDVSNGIIRSLYYDEKVNKKTESHEETLLAIVFEKTTMDEVPLNISLNNRYENEVYIDEAPYDFNINALHTSTDNIDLLQEDIQCYPNPFVDLMYISLENSNNEYDRMKIYSIEGKLILSESINEQSMITINGSSLPYNGQYFVKLSGPKGNVTKKVVKI